ncbi:MAG: MerR family transcriptional regulator [Arachnia sp.]
MQISELSAATGVSVASLKYYLREGLLMPGIPTAATRATYTDMHVARVRLLRALHEIGGLSIAAARAAVHALENPPATTAELLHHAHDALPAPGDEAPESGEVKELVAGLGWQVEEDSTARQSLTTTLDALRDGGVPMSSELLRAYAEAVLPIAELDIATVAEATSAAEALNTAVVGTVLLDPVLSSLRRLAQQHLACERLA